MRKTAHLANWSHLCLLKLFQKLKINLSSLHSPRLLRYVLTTENTLWMSCCKMVQSVGLVPLILKVNRETHRVPMYQFTLQLPTITWTGLGQNKQSRIQSWSPTWMAAVSHLLSLRVCIIRKNQKQSWDLNTDDPIQMVDVLSSIFNVLPISCPVSSWHKGPCLLALLSWCIG